MTNFVSLVSYHEFDTKTEGLAYFVPLSKALDPLGDALREQGGPRMVKELGLSEGQAGEAVLRRGYGSKAAYIVVTPAPHYDPVTRAGGDAYAAALGACLDAAEERGLRSLTFGSWPLAAAEMPGRVAAMITFNTLERWRDANRRRRNIKRVVLALHDPVGNDIFGRVGATLSSSSVIALPNITGEDAIWKVEKLLF